MEEKRFGGIFEQELVAAKNRENFSTNQWIEFQQAELQKILCMPKLRYHITPKNLLKQD
jgi:hypothetical protein